MKNQQPSGVFYSVCCGLLFVHYFS